jgi:hypothetical protein
MSASTSNSALRGRKTLVRGPIYFYSCLGPAAHQTLGKFKVPDPERQEPIANIESTKEAIVISPFQERPATATAGEERS